MTSFQDSTITKDQITQVVDLFYDRVQLDQNLSAPFSIVTDWAYHKKIITHFWWMTLGGDRYMDHKYSVAQKHRAVGFTPELLNQHWLPLFEQTIREVLPDTLSDVWLVQARRIGRSLELNHNYMVAQSESDKKQVLENTFLEIKRL